MFKLKYAIILGLAVLLIAVFALYFPSLGVLILIAALLAYVLDPVVVWCEKRNCARWLSASLLVFGLSIVLLGLIAPALPAIFQELIKIARAFPHVYDTEIAPHMVEMTGVQMNWDWILGHLPADTMEIASFGAGIGSLVGISLHTLLFLMLVFIILRDWERIVAATRQLLHDLTPDDWNAEIDALFVQIGKSLSKLIRGQVEVSTILAVYYLVLFQTIGVIAEGDFQSVPGFIAEFFTPSAWMLIGAITGYLNLIPYIGVPIGGCIAALLALVSFQFAAIWIYPALIIIVTLGTTIDHKMLTPTVIGRSVSVHELWVYVAIYVGFSVGGIVGVILALPVMTVISEVVKRSFALWHAHRQAERQVTRSIETI